MGEGTANAAVSFFENPQAIEKEILDRDIVHCIAGQ